MSSENTTTIASNHDFDSVEETPSKLWRSYASLTKRNKFLFILSTIILALFFIISIIGGILAILYKYTNPDLSVNFVIVFGVFCGLFFMIIVPYLVFGLRYINNLEDI